ERVIPLNGFPEEELLRLAATAERHSEHPLAEAVRNLATRRGIAPDEPADFEAVPGAGVRAQVNGHVVTIGSAAFSSAAEKELARRGPDAATGTLLYVDVDGRAGGVLAAADTGREEIPDALEALRS